MIVERYAGLVHIIQGRPETFFLLVPQGIIARYAIQKLGIGQQLLGDRIVGIELGRLFGRYLSLFVALFVAQAVEFVEFLRDFFFCLLFHPPVAVNLLASVIVLFRQIQTRLILVDILLGFADRTIRPSQQLIARARFQTRLFHFFAAFLQGTQGPFRIRFPHRPGVRFQVGQIGGDLPRQDLLPGGGLVQQTGQLAAGLGRARVHGLESNCK